MKAVGCFAYLAAAVPLTIYHGWVLSVLWGWFVQPLFGLAALTIPFAIGLSMIVSFLTYHHKSNGASDDKEWWEPLVEGLVIGLLRPTFALLFGWVVVQFI